MTTRYEYKCDVCGHNYIEQRGDNELDIFFIKCLACATGDYQETAQVFLEPDPEPVIVESVPEE